MPLVAALLVLLSTVSPAAGLSNDVQPLSAGNRGANVRALQTLLRAAGSMVSVTGVMDAATVTAVTALQAGHGITADGVVGVATWTILLPRLSRGARGLGVVALQRLLNEKRHAGLETDGVFGIAEQDAVLAFQRHGGLPASGTANQATWRRLLAHLELPAWGSRLCDYSVGNGPANWGTANAIGQLEAAADAFGRLGYGRPALGDIGYEHGGDIAGHETHEQGLDVDLRPMRRDHGQCVTPGTRWSSTAYDRAATRALVLAIRDAAPGHVKLIYFNDPVLIREGLVTWHSGHDDHLHVRYCESVHADPRYDC